MVLLRVEGAVCVLTIDHLVIFAPYRVIASCGEYYSIAILSEKNGLCYGSLHLIVEHDSY